MPPRRRPKKVGLTRMDAAIDALKPMGYPPDFVRRKVKQLLSVYGDEGWPFIEEGSYTLLIDCILEGELGEPSSKNAESDLYITEVEPSQPEPSSKAIEPLCCTQDALELSPVTDSQLEPSRKAIEPLCFSQDALQTSPTRDLLREPSSEVIEPLCSSQDALLLSPVTVLNTLLPLGETSLSPSKNDSSPNDMMSLDPFHGLCLEHAHPPRVRKPCFGWIGSKDDDDFVLLKRAPVQGWGSGEWRRKRKSRWDVGPDDIVRKRA